MLVIAFFALVAAACVFFLYVLVQFWRAERQPRRSNDSPVGFPVISSGQIVMPLATLREERRNDSADQKNAKRK